MRVLCQHQGVTNGNGGDPYQVRPDLAALLTAHAPDVIFEVRQVPPVFSKPGGLYAFADRGPDTTGVGPYPCDDLSPENARDYALRIERDLAGRERAFED